LGAVGNSLTLIAPGRAGPARVCALVPGLGEGRVPIDCKIDHDRRFVHATAQGVVVLDEILNYFDAVTIADAASYRKLFDARDIDLRLSDDDFMVLAARVSAYGAFDPRGPVATVANGDEVILAMRRFANFAGAEDRPLRLFDDIDAAQAWLDSLPPTA